MKMLRNVVWTLLTLSILEGAYCIIPENLKSDFFNIHKHVAIETRDIQNKPVAPENITYFLYTSENPKNYVKFDSGNLEVLSQQRNKIVFFIHGWTNSREIEWYEDLKNAFLTTFGNNYSIVQVDWKDPANQLYYVSSINTYEVAKILANVIIDLKENHDVSLDDILLIGHSLGGQITGFVGKIILKKVGRKLPRIIALDPAGPLFDTRPEDKRLNKNDADIVEVIHSDGGTFGFNGACGTIDFFPNGGSSQPGCKRIDLLDLSSITEPINCDHHRAYEYFVEAILNPTELVAKKCRDWSFFKQDKCEKDEVALGDILTRASGKYYLETNKERPFSRRAKTEAGLGLSRVLTLLRH